MATSATGRTRLRDERLVARVTGEQKRLFQRAADIQGRSLSDFIVATAQEAAVRAVDEHVGIQLDVAASEAFVAEMLAPSPLPDRLTETIDLYRRRSAG